MKFWSLSFKPDHRPLFFLSYIRHTWISLVICQLGSTKNNPTEAAQIRRVEMCSPGKVWSVQVSCVCCKICPPSVGFTGRAFAGKTLSPGCPLRQWLRELLPCDRREKSINQSINHTWSMKSIRAARHVGSVVLIYCEVKDLCRVAAVLGHHVPRTSVPEAQGSV